MYQLFKLVCTEWFCRIRVIISYIILILNCYNNDKETLNKIMNNANTIIDMYNIATIP